MRQPRLLAKPTPAAILARTPLPVLVATAGGGIQAAAWTTRVFLGIAETCDCDIVPNVALVSSVSGGSVGAMYFGANISDLKKASRDSRLPSLDEAAWGWVNPDVWHALLPWFGDHEIDRGWALERSWQRRVGEPSLATWAGNAAASSFPAFLFNTTRVESGTPLVFATSEYPKTELPLKLNVDSFDRRYGGRWDVRVTTAVRLSSSFPYVAPAARSSARCVDCKDYHVVDGGYYDNYGLQTLIGWLDGAFATGARPAKVHVLQIRSFPATGTPPGKLRGWGYQSWVPADAFLKVRDSAQLAAGHTEIGLFQSYAKSKYNVVVETSEIEYPAGVKGCEKPPLSWKLTEAQKNCIDSAWDHSGKEQASEVVGFLKGGKP